MSRPNTKNRKFAPATLSLALLPVLLSACALQAPYSAPAIEAPQAWSAVGNSSAAAAPDNWWTLLGDPAIDALAAAALADNPTLEQALARRDEARANLGISAAAQRPALDLSASAGRSRTLDSGATTTTGNAALGLGLSWEIDLFGRVRSGVDSAQRRLDARAADADATRLSLLAQVADSVLQLRACHLSLQVLDGEIASRQTTLQLTARRVSEGYSAPVQQALASSGLAAARTARTSREEQCQRHVNALAALSGQPAAAVRTLLAAALRDSVQNMPRPPATGLALPAVVLARHPSVRAAENEVASAWAEIGVARAERMPRLDLGAALSGQWLRAAGASVDYTAWSLGPGLSAALFDGGRGAANVDAASARYRAALAVMRNALRNAARDVENALAATASAGTRLITTREAVDAAQLTLDANQASWQAGAVSLFELEDSRRQLAAAQDSAIGAAQNSGQAWVALMLASGHSALTSESPNHDHI